MLRVLALSAGLARTGWLPRGNLPHWLDYGRYHVGHTDFALYYTF